LFSFAVCTSQLEGFHGNGTHASNATALSEFLELAMMMRWGDAEHLHVSFSGKLMSQEHQNKSKTQSNQSLSLVPIFATIFMKF